MNVQERDSLDKLIEEKIGDLMAHQRDQGVNNADKILMFKLYRFFRHAVSKRWIRTLKVKDDREKGRTSIIIDQIEEMARKEPGSEHFDAKCLREFAQRNLDNVSMTPANCHAVQNAFPHTKVYNEPNNAEMREAWNEMVGVPPSWTPHFLKRMTRDDDVPTTEQNCPLVGDYLLFRADSLGKAKPAFFRFYPHEIGERIRSMGLRLDGTTRGLSSKGWVIRQGGGRLMVAGYIIDRKNTGNVSIDGGFSLMSVSVDVRSELVQIANGRIDMAPIIHMQMPYAFEASCSRGILIRLLNADKLGGQRDQSKEERNEATLNLQRQLISRFAKELTLTQVAKILAEASGVFAHAFYQYSGFKDDHIPHLEAFVNSPRSQSEKDDFVFAPLTITNVHTKTESVINKVIGIDFTSPPSQFRS